MFFGLDGRAKAPYYMLPWSGGLYPFSHERPLCVHVFAGETFGSQQLFELMALNRTLVPRARRKPDQGKWAQRHAAESHILTADELAGDDRAVFFNLGFSSLGGPYWPEMALAFDLLDLFRFGRVHLRPHDLLDAYTACTKRREGKMECIREVARYGSLTDRRAITEFAGIWSHLVYWAMNLLPRPRTLRGETAAVFERMCASAAERASKYIPGTKDPTFRRALAEVNWRAPFMLRRLPKIPFATRPPEVLVFGDVPLRAAKFYRDGGVWRPVTW